jgi:probable HAF family extracellular repeat protein
LEFFSNMTTSTNNQSAALVNPLEGPGGRSALEKSTVQSASRSSNNAPLYYGQGNDIISLGNGKNIVYAGEGINLITTGLGNDLITSGNNNDFINAGDGKNVISAGNGNNRILSGKGDDIIFAGSGNDAIYSGAGNDSIFTGDGNNIVNAGTGEDSVTLGSGTDKLILEGGKGSVKVIGFDLKADKLRLGDSLAGKALKFETKGNDTLVMSGKDLLATLVGVKGGSQAIVDKGALYTYTATDLGSLSSNANGNVNATAINDFGQIAGRFDTGATFSNTNATTGVVNNANLVRNAFIWENGKQIALTSTGIKTGQGDFGAANGATVTMLTPNVNTITNTGIILGTGDEVRQPNPLATDRGLRWTKEGETYKLSISDFGEQESYFLDANGSGQIAGRNINKEGFETPLAIAADGTITRLATLGGDGGTTRGINGKGVIVGALDIDGLANDTYKNTAAVWEKGSDGKFKLTNLGTFGYDQASLRDLNNAGTIIGQATNGTGATATSNAFMIRDGEFMNLGSLGGKTGSTTGINESGQVIGASQIASGTNRAFVYEGAGAIADLNSLVSAPLTYNGAAVTLTNAASINNFGQIVATGTYTYKDAAGKDATGTRSYVLNAA